MSSYCVKCKKKTKNVGGKIETAKNGQRMLKSKCAVCGTKKVEFISKQSGGNPAAIAAAAGNAAGGLGSLGSSIAKAVDNRLDKNGFYQREQLRKNREMLKKLTMDLYVEAKRRGAPILAEEARKIAMDLMAKQGLVTY
ncbi:MAG: hypothetical protein BGO27_03560 [Alphaproteobacteria bacterium 33-17]|nr:MAG: hypothetical protein BGO27_03560 [Alphaproteobacteria bacterium 33-17]